MGLSSTQLPQRSSGSWIYAGAYGDEDVWAFLWPKSSSYSTCRAGRLCAKRRKGPLAKWANHRPLFSFDYWWLQFLQTGPATKRPQIISHDCNGLDCKLRRHPGRVIWSAFDAQLLHTCLEILKEKRENDVHDKWNWTFQVTKEREQGFQQLDGEWMKETLREKQSLIKDFGSKDWLLNYHNH